MARVPQKNIDLTDREWCRRVIDTRLASPGHAQLHPYLSEVRRWMDCAPEGAVFLIAPLTGWRGEPFTSKDPVGPGVAKNLRQAREARGIHPFGVEAGAAA